MDKYYRDTFFLNCKLPSISLEVMAAGCNTFEEFEAKVSEEFLKDDTRTGDYLEKLMIKYDKKNATVSEEAGLHRSYVGNIINGKKEPGRDAIIAICIAIGTTLEELQDLLKFAGHAQLYVRRKRDLIIWFGIDHHKSIMEIDADLYERGYDTFFKYE